MSKLQREAPVVDLAHHPGPAAGRFQRTTFCTNRMLDFCSERELIAQTGHQPVEWPLVVLKELIDNALDACEEHDIPPAIGVTVNRDGITVADNGPGVAAATIDGVLDFAVRVSSREAYVAPDRGAQGNALKTLVTMPYVLDGRRGHLDITVAGVAHAITVELDGIRQQPVITRTCRSAPGTRGTRVHLYWPENSAGLLSDTGPEFLQMAEAFTFLNPHVTLAVDWFGKTQHIHASTPTCRKWKPNEPTAAHWYNPEHFARLVRAYLANDAQSGRARTVRELIAEFRGLTGSARQKAVLHTTGLIRQPLASLQNGKDVDHARVAALLRAMQRHSKPVPPRLLGAIGREHFRARFASAGCAMGTFEYRSHSGVTDGVPWLAECAFAWRPGQARRFIVGVNWSPGIRNPFRTLGTFGQSLDAILEQQRVSHQEPIMLALHLACPRVEYADRGKSSVILPGETGTKLAELVRRTTDKWARVRLAEERQEARIGRRHEILLRSYRVTIREAAFEIMAAAYAKASGNGALPAGARQIMYAARGHILKRTGHNRLDDQYFTQTLLPDYIAEHPEARAWDVVFDARGHFTEPHTGAILPLGTMEVREYLATRERASDAGGPITIPEPVVPANHRYNAVLFIEKEGWMPLFKKAQLAERYDLALMSTKGMSTTAGRLLVDTVCGEDGRPFFVLHDFDKSGLSILGTLSRSGRRYCFKHAVHVVDLGLRLADVTAWGLESEPVSYGKSDPRPNLRENGATAGEMAFLCEEHGGYRFQGQRVELNAFSSPDLLRWIEGKLQEHGVKKVLPAEAVLRDAFRQAYAREILRARLAVLGDDAQREAAAVSIPADLPDRVRRKLQRYRALPWDAVIRTLAEQAAAARGRT